jgi:hypothetical protein
MSSKSAAKGGTVDIVEVLHGLPTSSVDGQRDNAEVSSCQDSPFPTSPHIAILPMRRVYSACLILADGSARIDSKQSAS